MQLFPVWLIFVQRDDLIVVWALTLYYELSGKRVLKNKYNQVFVTEYL